MEIIKLNLIPSGVNPTCHCSQYDNGRVIRIDLFDGLTPYVLQSGDTVTLNVRKPDNTIVTASLTATQGNTYVEFTTTEQICACVGYNLCDLTITNGAKVIGTLNFIMAIERDVLADGIPSQSVIEDLDARVQEAVGDNYYTKAEIDDIFDNLEADDIPYDNVISGLQATNVQAAIDEITNYLNSISDNKKIKIVAGVIHNNGSGWEFINDANHTPINLSSVSVSGAGHIVINYAFTAKKVLSLVYCPDETFFTQYALGASVGLSNATLKVSKKPVNISGYINYDGTNWNISNCVGVTSVSFSSGKLTINHENLGDLGLGTKYTMACSVNGRAIDARMDQVGLSSLSIKFYDNSGNVITTPTTDMKLYFSRNTVEQIVNANNVASDNGNFWIFGAFEV